MQVGNALDNVFCEIKPATTPPEVVRYEQNAPPGAMHFLRLLAQSDTQNGAGLAGRLRKQHGGLR